MYECSRSAYRRSGAFTLIEMLVVIVVILLLSGILLKSVAHFGEEGKRKETVFELEQLQNALNEYFAEYGSYPPVNTMVYEYEDNASNHQSSSFITWLGMHNNPDDPVTFFPDMFREADAWPCNSSKPDWSLGYRYGLVSYLWPRKIASQVHWYNEDTERDVKAKGRWASFLDEVPRSWGYNAHTATPSMAIATIWTNLNATVTDPWGNEYQYRCLPPYLRYKLWSVGPDGVSGTTDDIANDSFDE